MSHQIFICAAPRDKIAANAIRAVLEAEGMACWLASRDLPTGADPVETAGAAIAAAQFMVLVFSSRANEAEEQIKRELQFAAQHQTPVLPFRVENVKPVRGLEYFLPANQFMDAFPPPLDPHLRRLAAMLKPAVEKAAPRPPMPASLQPAAAVPEPEPAATEHDFASPQPEALSPVSEPQAELALPPAAAPQADLPTAPIEAEIANAAPAVTVPMDRAGQRPDGPVHSERLPRSRKPLILALAAVLLIAAGAGAWWLLRPGPSTQELRAWNSASQQDVIPAYQSYLAAWPKGFYRDQAAARTAALTSQVQAAFAKAKAANTSAAYENFLALYARQGVDVPEARTADDAARAQEAKAKAAFDAAAAAHTRDSYKSFLADFASGPYAADARQRLAACRTETRNTTTVKNVPLSESAEGSAGSSAEACAAARDKATKQATDSCRESAGRLGSVRVVSEAPRSDGLQGGRILGSIFGAISGDRKMNWKCSEQISVSCEISTSGVHQVDICP